MRLFSGESLVKTKKAVWRKNHCEEEQEKQETYGSLEIVQQGRCCNVRRWFPVWPVISCWCRSCNLGWRSYSRWIPFNYAKKEMIDHIPRSHVSAVVMTLL